ncbi:MAG: hypothetical protein WBA76_07460 [Phormidesmis sp.]
MATFNQYRQKLKALAVRSLCLMMVTVAVWGGAWVPNATAVGSEKAGAIMNERAAAELDRMSGAGTSDQFEGAVQNATGKAKRGAARVTGELDDSLGDKLGTAKDRMGGAADELKGNVKRDVGRAKGAAADAGDDVEDKATGVVESIKDFFD